jgi:N-acylglucosamine-6-phosphate 2-epimerase
VNDSSLIERLRGGLIVSCQALAGEPLHGSQYMAAMARAAAQGGAVAIRANGPADIAAIRSTVDLPIIGLFKDDLPGFDVRITPTLNHARQISEAGAQILAIDATARPHADGVSIADRIRFIHNELHCLVLADISVFDEARQAAEAGADLVATTLSGYTASSPSQTEPDFALVEQLAKSVGGPVIAEGRFATPAQATQALRLGAHAVVVGTAITRPQWITARFVEGLRAHA